MIGPTLNQPKLSLFAQYSFLMSKEWQPRCLILFGFFKIQSALSWHHSCNFSSLLKAVVMRFQSIKSKLILIFSAFSLLGFLSACADQSNENRTRDFKLNPDTQLQGTQIGNPVDLYPNAVRVLINNEAPSSSDITINAEDTFTCDSQIDLSEFEQELNELGLILTYFIKVTSDQGIVRNFMHQVMGSAIVHYFGAGSNLVLVCQAIIYTQAYEIVYDEFSAPLSCSNCGQSNTEGN